MTGLEALDDATLGALDKRTEAAMNKEALAILERAGIGVSAGFVLLPEAGEVRRLRFPEITVVTLREAGERLPRTRWRG